MLVEYAGSGHNDPTALLWLALPGADGTAWPQAGGLGGPCPAEVAQSAETAFRDALGLLKDGRYEAIVARVMRL